MYLYAIRIRLAYSITVSVLLLLHSVVAVSGNNRAVKLFNLSVALRVQVCSCKRRHPQLFTNHLKEFRHELRTAIGWNTGQHLMVLPRSTWWKFLATIVVVLFAVEGAFLSFESLSVTTSKNCLLVFFFAKGRKIPIVTSHIDIIWWI